jgi:hypothetical protein
MKNAIYTLQRKYTRWRALFPGTFLEVAHDWRQVLMFEGKTCSHGRAFTTCE